MMERAVLLHKVSLDIMVNLRREASSKKEKKANGKWTNRTARETVKVQYNIAVYVRKKKLGCNAVVPKSKVTRQGEGDPPLRATTCQQQQYLNLLLGGVAYGLS